MVFWRTIFHDHVPYLISVLLTQNYLALFTKTSIETKSYKKKNIKNQTSPNSVTLAKLPIYTFVFWKFASSAFYI